MIKPVGVFISDVHYNLQTIKLADAAMEQAIDKANSLKVPLIIPGDLHDSKANLRGECVNAIINTIKKCHSPPYIIVGNHCKINEKSDEHSLNFLAPYAAIIDYLPNSPLHRIGYLIPYQHDPETLRKYLKTIPKGSQVIMHQGLVDSHMGDYIMDKSAITKEDVAGLRVISGHYHARQTIELPDGGKWDYVGNPYTMSFGEANDPPKGYQILYNDGSLEFVPTNLRKHVVIEMDGTKGLRNDYNIGDLIWVKLYAKYEDLKVYTRSIVAQMLNIEGWPFKLDLIPLDTKTQAPTKQLANVELLDSLIDSMTNTSDDRKAGLKELWRRLGS